MIDTTALTPQATALLQASTQDPASADKARAAAYAAAGCGRWDLAVGLLHGMVQGGQADAASLLAYGYGLLGAGDYDGAAALTETIRPLFGGFKDAQRQVLADIGQQVYPQIASFYAIGEQRRAEMLADMILPYEPFGRRLLGIDPPPADGVARPDQLTDEAVEAFIRDRSAAFQPEEVPDRAVAADIGRHQGRRVLILHRKHYHPNLKSGPHPASQYFQQSAEDAGLEVRLITSDFACGVAARFDPEQAAREQEEIGALIEQWHPDFVVCDAFGGKGQDAITDLILDLRMEQGFRLIGIYHDIWLPDIRNLYADGMAEVDAIWFFDPLSTTEQMTVFPNAIGTVPPIPERPFADALARVKKTRDLGFIGSIWNSNHIRGVWLMALQRQGVSVDVVTGYPYAANQYQTAEEFADFMASCKVTLCFCGRTSQKGALPARVWEGIWAGSVLLEDDTSHLRHYLAPFVHYIPFRTLEELTFYAGFLKRREDVREQMAVAARDFVRARYSLQQVWGAVLDMAMASPGHGRG